MRPDANVNNEPRTSRPDLVWLRPGRWALFAADASHPRHPGASLERRPELGYVLRLGSRLETDTATFSTLQSVLDALGAILVGGVSEAHHDTRPGSLENTSPPTVSAAVTTG
jgi:hypothetical protein